MSKLTKDEALGALDRLGRVPNYAEPADMIRADVASVRAYLSALHDEIDRLQSAHEAEVGALRAERDSANEYAERCTAANTQAERDNDELRSRLREAERDAQNTPEARPWHNATLTVTVPDNGKPEIVCTGWGFDGKGLTPTRTDFLAAVCRWIVANADDERPVTNGTDDGRNLLAGDGNG